MPQNYDSEGQVQQTPTDLGSTVIQEKQQIEHAWSDWTGGHGQRDFDDASKGSKGEVKKPPRVEADTEAGELDSDAW